MTRINMIKYGFKRWPEEDFTDDGSRFTCYKVGDRVRVSKTIWNEMVYLNARIDSGKLDWETYSKLPHYGIISKLNGVTIASLTEDDLQELYENCLTYEAEYIDAEEHMVCPTADEVREQCLKIRAHYQEQLDELTGLINANVVALLFKLSDYNRKDFKSYFETIKSRATGYDPEKCIANKDSAWGQQFVKPTNNDLVDHWYYDQLIKMIKVCTA